MFYLFSSDFEPRFKRNVLDILCYPEKHIFRFRYHANHVSPEIQHWVKSDLLETKLQDVGTKGVCIYAETTGTDPTRTFTFYPLREVDIIRVQLIGNVYYVDMRLGAFIDYFSGGETPEQMQSQLSDLQESINKLKFHPLPQLKSSDGKLQKQGLTWNKAGEKVAYAGETGFTNQGYFFYHVQPADAITCHCGTGSLRPWESVAEVLSTAPSMQRAVFYLVEGFYLVRRSWILFGKHQEYFIEPVDNGWDTKYRLKMGTSVVLKLLFFRSSKAPRITDRTLEVKTDGDAFAGFSQKEIPVESRYNEERILIACKRVFDSVFALIEIQLKPDTKDSDHHSQFFTRVKTPSGEFELNIAEPKSEADEVIAAHSFLLTQVTASQKVIIATLIFLALASFFLFMSPDYIVMIGGSKLLQSSSPEAGSLLMRNAPALTQASKTLGFVFTLLAGYFGFRKLPLGK